MNGQAATGVLVDPGDDAPAIIRFLEEKRIAISLIVLTHGHLDHISALPALMEAWKDHPPKIAIHGLDAHYLGGTSAASHETLFNAIGATSFFQQYWKPLPEPDVILADGEVLPGTGLKVIHTPGHSAGSISLYESESGMLFSGDTLFRDGIGRSDGPDADPEALRVSLDKLSLLPPETAVFPGHGARTTIGRELSRQKAPSI
jgi:glyoxylase-like metal-dependent hydrolase (beta-lactamase superfamily II)